VEYSYEQEQAISEVFKEKIRDVHDEVATREFTNQSKKEHLQKKLSLYQSILYQSRVNLNTGV
jgi:hypothetical protein